MPCDYLYKSIMMTYITLARLRAQKLADGSPFILVGDFNTTPDKKVYKALTDVNLDTKCLDKYYPPEDKWRPDNLRLLINTCDEVGKSPKYTNRAKFYIRGEKKDFTGTLDYILVSDDIKVVDAEVCPNDIDSYNKYSVCPNEYEPSDHIPVVAEILI
jgi:endonuclease/exonuclease/phosphatase family metal-dependent hydrolase